MLNKETQDWLKEAAAKAFGHEGPLSIHTTNSSPMEVQTALDNCGLSIFPVNKTQGTILYGKESFQKLYVDYIKEGNQGWLIIGFGPIIPEDDNFMKWKIWTSSTGSYLLEFGKNFKYRANWRPEMFKKAFLMGLVGEHSTIHHATDMIHPEDYTRVTQSFLKETIDYALIQWHEIKKEKIKPHLQVRLFSFPAGDKTLLIHQTVVGRTWLEAANTKMQVVKSV